MQKAVPEVLDLDRETGGDASGSTASTTRATAVYGRRLLAARRLAEQGVRFTLVYLSDYGEWDSHNELQEPARPQCAPRRQADRRAAQGPEAHGARQGRAGRLLHRVRPHAGPGDARRATRCRPAATTTRTASPSGSPAPGSSAASSTARPTSWASTPSSTPHYVTDIHATVLHLLGLDPRRLDVPGRKRLEIDYGNVIERFARDPMGEVQGRQGRQFLHTWDWHPWPAVARSLRVEQRQP